MVDVLPTSGTNMLGQVLALWRLNAADAVAEIPDAGPLEGREAIVDHLGRR